MSDPPDHRTTGDAQTDGLRTLGGRYVAEHELARGGMGTVYAGRDSVLARPVAIKVLDPEPGAVTRREFLREARAVAALKHQHIVDVYDAGLEGDTPYIVMEYVPGETLRELIAREAPLEPARAAALTAHIADALDYAHRRGVVHCDIKPGNILLPTEEVPKIVDFGIARTAGATATFTDQVIGTAAYMAPEQVQGERPDGRADVYSLAAVLYEMLVATPPFTGRNLAAVAAQRLTQDPKPPRDVLATVPAQLSHTVTRGLARDREDRFATAAEFATALRDATEGTTQSVTRVIGPVAAAPAVRERLRGDAVAAPAPSTGAVMRRHAPWVALAVVGAIVAGAAAGAVLLIAGVFGGESATVSVPDVVNQSLIEAERPLHDFGLEIEVQLVPGQQPYLTVIGQDPPQGTRVRTGSTVKLRVVEPPP